MHVHCGKTDIIVAKDFKDDILERLKVWME